MKYYVYMLKSFKDKRFYIGCTAREPELRLSEHNKGQVSSTRNRRPFKLVWKKEFADKKEAFKKEWYLKHPAGYQEKLNIINNL